MKQKILMGVSVFLLLFISISIIFVIKAHRPIGQAKKEAVAIAKKHSSLVQADDFYWYNRDETFYTVAGRDKSGAPLLVVVPKKGETINTYKQSDGLTKDEAIAVVTEKGNAHKVTRINFGLLEDEPIWEVLTEDENGAISYYSVSFETGEIITIVKNV